MPNSPLSRSLLADPAFTASLPHGPLEPLPERILQFGEGNFLRAFADWMVDELNAKGLFGGSVVAVQPIRPGMAPQLNAQDGLYTLILRGVEAGQTVDARRVVTSISRALNPYDDWAALVELATRREVRFVISNTTEAGIAYVAEPRTPGVCPESFPAKVAALLYERFLALQKNGGADGALDGALKSAKNTATGLVFIPCELIEANGAKLREYVLRHAAAWGLGAAFTAWVERENVFLNTLVDRIVPGYPRAEAEGLCAELGYADQLLDTGEIFHLWVIEGASGEGQAGSPNSLAELAEEIPFHKAGLNVVWTDNMAPYRTRKVRILNGAHTANVLAAFLGGLSTVREMMEDADFGRLARRAIFEEIVPVLNMEPGERRAYAEAVIERFLNPFIRHELISISLNSVSKWKVRVLPSLLDYISLRGELPPALTASLAALILFYKGTRPDTEAAATTGKPTELQGQRTAENRTGEPYPIRDDADILAFFAERWAEHDAAVSTSSTSTTPATPATPATQKLVTATLAQTAFWGQDLNALPGFAEAVTAALQTMLAHGTRAAAREITRNKGADAA